MSKSNYPKYIDELPHIIDDEEGNPDLSSDDVNLIQEAVLEIQKTLGTNPQEGFETVKKQLRHINEKMTTNDIPFNLSTEIVTKEDGTEEIEVSFNYIESEDIEHFVLEVWDEETQSYEPYDGQLGIIGK